MPSKLSMRPSRFLRISTRKRKPLRVPCRCTTGRPSGGSVVDMMSDTRAEFEQAKANLEKEEAEAVKDFQEVKQHHLKVASDLQADLNQLKVQKQSAEMQLDSAQQ